MSHQALSEAWENLEDGVQTSVAKEAKRFGPTCAA